MAYNASKMDLDLCQNCGRPLPKRRRIYCSYLCGETAGFVRWVRRKGLERIWSDDDLSWAYDNQLRFVLGEGYRTNHSVTPETRKTVYGRDASKCVICGAQGAEIDHINPTADADVFNEAGNLQLLCTSCHRSKTEASLVPVKLTPQQKQLYEELHKRIDSELPIKICDDEVNWPRYYKHWAFFSIALKNGMDPGEAIKVAERIAASRRKQP